jgi:hypothetical protein
MAITNEVLIWHKTGMVKTNRDGCRPMDIDEYIQAGQPDTWSPILTHFMRGYAPVYRQNMDNPKAREDFLGNYLNTLVSNRSKRSEAKEAA